MQRLMCRSLYAQKVEEEETLINEQAWKITYRMEMGVVKETFVAVFEFIQYDNMYNPTQALIKRYRLSVNVGRVWDTTTVFAFMDIVDAVQLDHELMALRYPSFFLSESFNSHIQIRTGPRGFMLPLYGILRILKQQNWSIPDFNPYLKLGGIMLFYRVDFSNSKDLIKLEFMIQYDAWTGYPNGAEARKVETYEVTFPYTLFDTYDIYQQYNKVVTELATYLYTFSGFTKTHKMLLEQDWFSKEEEDAEEGQTDCSLDDFEVDLYSF